MYIHHTWTWVNIKNCINHIKVVSPNKNVMDHQTLPLSGFRPSRSKSQAPPIVASLQRTTWWQNDVLIFKFLYNLTHKTKLSNDQYQHSQRLWELVYLFHPPSHFNIYQIKHIPNLNSHWNVKILETNTRIFTVKQKIKQTTYVQNESQNWKNLKQQLMWVCASVCVVGVSVVSMLQRGAKGK